VQRWSSKIVATAELWSNENEMEESLFRMNDDGIDVENEIKVSIIDIPAVHCFQEKIGDEFFDNLARVERINMFENNIIMSIIDYKWPLVKKYTTIFLFVPFVIYLASFIVFSNVLDVQISENQDYRKTKLAFIIILYILSAYFLLTEFGQLFHKKLLYFSTVWNIPDILVPVLVLVVISYHLKELHTADYVKPNFIVSVHTFCSFLIWIKFLYFLRIYRLTSYFIRMLSTVIWEIRTFLLVLLIVYLGFGEAFLRLSQNSPDAPYVPNYAYSLVYAFRLSIGDTDTDKFDDGAQPVSAWLIFILCALFTNIIMLNLLIALISESFGKINSNSISANYQERARLISENSYLIPASIKEAYCERQRYLIVADEVIEADKGKQ
jgi:hypothetical protein